MPSESSPRYLDHAATTPLDPRVLEEMAPYWTAAFGNPSSAHRAGARAREAVNRAREQIADRLGASRKEIVFTASGTEAINLAVKGAATARRAEGRGQHVITDAVEHHATLHAVEALRPLGFQTTVLPVDATGRVSPEAVRAALRPDTVLVSVMYANNEIGTVQPVAEIGRECRARGVLFHVDAVQAVGALPLEVDPLGADLLSVSGHKFHGPKGTGFLYVRQGTPLVPQMSGGGQEGKLRAGTENVPGIVGLAAALRLALEEQEAHVQHCRELRDRLVEGILRAVPDARLNGHPTGRLPGNAHFTFPGLEGSASTESLLAQLDAQGVCASTGSACNTRSLEPSHVLEAIGLSPADAFSSVRFSLGRGNTAEDIDHVLQILPGIVARLRKVSASPARPARPGLRAG